MQFERKSWTALIIRTLATTRRTSHSVSMFYSFFSRCFCVLKSGTKRGQNENEIFLVVFAAMVVLWSESGNPPAVLIPMDTARTLSATLMEAASLGVVAIDEELLADEDDTTASTESSVTDLASGPGVIAIDEKLLEDDTDTTASAETSAADQALVSGRLPREFKCESLTECPFSVFPDSSVDETPWYHSIWPGAAAAACSSHGVPTGLGCPEFFPWMRSDSDDDGFSVSDGQVNTDSDDASYSDDNSDASVGE